MNLKKIFSFTLSLLWLLLRQGVPSRRYDGMVKGAGLRHFESKTRRWCEVKSASAPSVTFSSSPYLLLSSELTANGNYPQSFP